MSYVVPSATISLAGARAALDAALARAEALGIAVSICILDAGAHEVLTARMDRAALLTTDLAADKAYTVATFAGRPSSQWAAAMESRPAVITGLNKMPRFSVLGGGVPLVVDGQVVGAIGVSGASSEQDVECAEAGAAAIA